MTPTDFVEFYRDFSMGLLDLFEDSPDVKLIGCCNELNACYGSDGYSRVKVINYLSFDALYY